MLKEYWNTLCLDIKMVGFWTTVWGLLFYPYIVRRNRKRAQQGIHTLKSLGLDNNDK